MKKIITALLVAAPLALAISAPVNAAQQESWQRAGAPDFKSFTDVRQMKHAFFAFLMPIVVKENQAIMERRKRLQGLRGKGTPTGADKQWLDRLAENYRMPTSKTPYDNAWFDGMMARVDVIPPSLALAQAANESGWGRSRFSRTANNYFGQWCFTKGCGIVPSARSKGATHEVQKFRRVTDSVVSYMHNLNSHPAYQGLRDARVKARNANKDVLGHDLAVGLVKYSERGDDYVKEIRDMIRINKLAQFDSQPTTAKIEG